MFIVSFIVVTVKARLIGFDRHLEEAAMTSAKRVDDLPQDHAAATRAGDAVRRPARACASPDDFVITYLNAGGEQTFPVYVWGIARVAVPPQVNVVASAIFLAVAIALALGNVFWQIRRQRQGAA